MVRQTANETDRRILADCVRPGCGPVPQFYRPQLSSKHKLTRKKKEQKNPTISGVQAACESNSSVFVMGLNTQ